MPHSDSYATNSDGKTTRARLTQRILATMLVKGWCQAGHPPYAQGIRVVDEAPRGPTPSTEDHEEVDA